MKNDRARLIDRAGDDDEPESCDHPRIISSGICIGLICAIISVSVWAVNVVPNTHELHNQIETSCVVIDHAETFSHCCDKPSSCACASNVVCPQGMPSCSSNINTTRQCCAGNCCAAEQCDAHCKVAGIWVCCWHSCMLQGRDICTVRCGTCYYSIVTYIREDQPDVHRQLQFNCSRDDKKCVEETREEWSPESVHACYYDRKSPNDTWFDKTKPNKDAVNAMWVFGAFAIIAITIAIISCIMLKCSKS